MTSASQPSTGFVTVTLTDASILEHPHNQQFRSTQASTPKDRELERESTPSLAEYVLILEPHHMKTARGFHFGSDPSQCDVFIGVRATGISGIHFRLSFDFTQDWPTYMVVTNTTDRDQGTLVNNRKLVRLMKEWIAQKTRYTIVAGSMSLRVEFDPERLTETLWNDLRRMASQPEDFTRLKILPSAQETPNVLPNVQMLMRGIATYQDVANAITNGLIPWHSGDEYVCMDEITTTRKSSVRKIMRASDRRFLAVKMIVNKSLSSGQIPPAEEILEGELQMSTLHLTQHNNGHPNVMKTVDFVAWQGARLLVMEFAACGNLEEYMHTVLPHALDEDSGRTIMVQVWRGLKWLHENDVSHGDLTAANILLRSLRPYDCVISDFGESRKGRKQTTLPGTLIYMAPEVARIHLHGEDGYEYDAQRADVWSTGILASRILTLKLPPIPSDGKWLAMFATLRGWSPTFEGLSENCSALLLRILSYDPSRRPTAAQCLDDDWHVDYPYELANDQRSSGETVRLDERSLSFGGPHAVEWAQNFHPDFSRLCPPPPCSLPDTVVPSFGSVSPKVEATTVSRSRYNLRPRVTRTT